MVGNDGDGDRTVIIPRPGGRTPGVAEGAVPPPARPIAGRPVQYQGGTPLEPPGLAVEGQHPWGTNGLVQAAMTLLMLMHQLRNTSHHDDPDALFASLTQELQTFERIARDLGEAHDAINAARYCLCTALDEAVMTTPWGSASAWRNRSLLATLHKETWGGDKLFLILDNLLVDPGRNVNLLELLYVILSLGFEGKYRVMDRGEARREELRLAVQDRLRAFREEPESELSPNWHGVGETRRAHRASFPLWVMAAMLAALVVTSHTVMSYVLDGAAEPIKARIERIAMSPAERR